jgi:radical SAM superfamily enzyme
VPVAAHLIFGLPQDGPGAERAAMDLLRTLPIWSIKIHPFHIVAGSALARAHARNPLPLLTRAQYVARVCDALAVASPHWVIQRLTGAAPGDRHVAPAWAVESRNLLAAIAREASARNLVQGCDLARATHATAEAATASNAATSNTPAPARHW